MTPHETTTIIFMSGLTLIYLATFKAPKFIIKFFGELYRGKLILKNHWRAFREYISVLVQYWSFCHKEAKNDRKLSRIKKRAEKQIKDGDIYSKKQV